MSGRGVSGAFWECVAVLLTLKCLFLGTMVGAAVGGMLVSVCVCEAVWLVTQAAMRREERKRKRKEG